MQTSGMGGMGSMGGMGGMGSMGGMGGMSPMMGMGGTPGGMGGMGGMGSMGGMGMSSPAAAPMGQMMPQAGMPMAAAPVPGVGEVTNLLAGMGTSATSNNDMIKMLAEEVVRLRKALEEKRGQSSVAGNGI